MNPAFNKCPRFHETRYVSRLNRPVLFSYLHTFMIYRQAEKISRIFLYNRAACKIDDLDISRLGAILEYLR